MNRLQPSVQIEYRKIKQPRAKKEYIPANGRGPTNIKKKKLAVYKALTKEYDNLWSF